ncbi:MAG: molybdopterin-dependent oxidoreductase, partial [Dehalococcoidia bacterium]|nr:molybdopterin-dependent oxidoreductase [Dehalococcoidia bacterium]
LDPLELRLKNAVDAGDMAHTGQVFGAVGLKGVLEAIRDYLKRQGPPGPGRAWGTACAQWGAGGTSSSAQLKINEDGTAVLYTGAMDTGTGSDTILCQIAAQELGLELEDMSIVAGDTDASPYDMASVGSRVTFSMGNAVRLAAADARQQLLERAAQVLEASPRDLEAAGRMVRMKGSPERAVSIAELAAASHVRVGPILGRGSFVAVAPAYNRDLVQGLTYTSRPGDTFCAQAALVEADPETGTVRLLGAVSAHDIGCAINPQAAEGQVEGCLGFGLGFALSEEILFEGGRTLNPLLLDYRLPTAVDMPMVESIFLEEPKSDGPYGAKGLGEPPTIPSGAAIANA